MHPSKQLLGFLAQELGEEKGSMDVYRCYLRAVLGADVSHYRLSKMPDNLLAKFYGSNDEEPPQYLAFRPSDIARLECSVGKRVQIFRKVGGKAEIAKLHDRTIYDSLDGQTLPLKFFLTFEYGGTMRLSRLGPEDGPKDCRLPETFFIGSISSRDCFCCLERVLSALSIVKQINHEHDSNCANVMSFCIALQCFEQHLPKDGLVIVSYLSTKFRVRHSWAPCDQTFGILGVLKGPRPTVLSFTSDGQWCYKVKEDFAAVIMSAIPPSRELPPRSKWAGLPHEAPEEEEPDEFSTCHVRGTDCECGPCSRSGQYVDNMKTRGRQQIYSFPMSSFDGLKIIGLFSHETEEDILFCSDASNAAWDAEAMTISTPQEIGNEDLLFPFESISQRKYPREAVARQEPILVSWADHSMVLANQQPLVYDVEDDESPDSEDCFAARFIRDILEAKKAATTLKRGRLSKILDFLSVLRQAHDAHFAVDVGDPEIHSKLLSINSAWRNGIFGLFQAQLERLINRWVIWGFNAEVRRFTFFLKKILQLYILGLRSGNPRIQVGELS
jgi:hypothetical protein